MARSIISRIRNRLALLDTTHSMTLKLPAPVATFTFDDFPASAYTIAGKMLEEVGARGTYFASAEFMGCRIDGIDFYTPELLKEMHAAGHEIGCHAFEHTHLGAKGAAFARETTTRNTAAMRKILGEQFMMTSFAYPYGDVSLSVKRAMARRFALCRGVYPGANTGSVDLAQIRIISLEMWHWNVAVAALKATIADARRNNSWVVFMTHDISASPTPYGSTPEMMQTVLKSLAAASIPIMPLKAAAAQGFFGETLQVSKV